MRTKTCTEKGTSENREDMTTFAFRQKLKKQTYEDLEEGRVLQEYYDRIQAYREKERLRSEKIEQWIDEMHEWCTKNLKIPINYTTSDLKKLDESWPEESYPKFHNFVKCKVLGIQCTL